MAHALPFRFGGRGCSYRQRGINLSRIGPYYGRMDSLGKTETQLGLADSRGACYDEESFYVC